MAVIVTLSPELCQSEDGWMLPPAVVIVVRKYCVWNEAVLVVAEAGTVIA